MSPANDSGRGGKSTPVRAAVYARLSLDRSGEGVRVEQQETDARRLAKQRGFKVVEVITDNSVSAAGKVTRAGFERLLSLVQDRQIEVIVARDIDRLTRNRPDTVRLIETCQEAGTLIALVRGSDLDLSSAAGRMTADILAAVARGEIETKSQRQIDAARHARLDGKWTGGARPFGYDKVRVKEGNASRVTLKVNEAEAEAVREGYRLILDGASLGEVARRWTAAGLTTPQVGHKSGSSAWNGTSVSRALRKPTLAGLRVRRRDRGSGRRNIDVDPVLRDADGQPVKTEWPALVDLDTWEAAQVILNQPDRRSPHGNQRLLTGVAECGLCDAGIHAGGAADGRGRYRCAAGRGHVNRLAAPVDQYVTQAVLYRLAEPDAADLLAPADDNGQTARLRAEEKRLLARRATLGTKYAQGRISDEALEAGEREVERLLAKIRADLPAAPRRPKALKQLVDAATDEAVAEVWESLPVETRREVIGLVARVVLFPPGGGVTAIRPEHVVIEFRA